MPEIHARIFPGRQFEAFHCHGQKFVPADSQEIILKHLFVSLGSRFAPEGSQETILKHFQAQIRNSRQKARRKQFRSISKPRPEIRAKTPRKRFSSIPRPSPEIRTRRFPGNHFEAFLGSGFKEAILKHFQAPTRTSRQKHFRQPF